MHLPPLAPSLPVLRESDTLTSTVLIAPLVDKCIAVLGYGNQGRAHAQNLRDSRLNVIVGGRPLEHGGTARARAAADGFESMDYSLACARADLVIVALPDQAQPAAWVRWIESSLRPGTVVGFVHGFAIRFGFIEPSASADLGIVLLAPKGPGTTVRERFLMGVDVVTHDHFRPRRAVVMRPKIARTKVKSQKLRQMLAMIRSLCY